MKNYTNNSLKQIKDKFPWNYLLIIRYGPFKTEDYFFNDLFDLYDFLDDFEYYDFDSVIYHLEPFQYHFKKED